MFPRTRDRSRQNCKSARFKTDGQRERAKITDEPKFISCKCSLKLLLSKAFSTRIKCAECIKAEFLALHRNLSSTWGRLVYRQICWKKHCMFLLLKTRKAWTMLMECKAFSKEENQQVSWCTKVFFFNCKWEKQVYYTAKTNNRLQGWFNVKEVLRHQTWQQPINQDHNSGMFSVSEHLSRNISLAVYCLSLHFFLFFGWLDLL